MDNSRFELFIEKLQKWCARNEDMIAVLLVGSHARGTARADSDIDLVLICQNPAKYCGNSDWIFQFENAEIGALEDWGLVKSWRAHFDDGLEVEFGITSKDWVSNEQIPNGTGAVVADGAKILYDPHGLLSELIKAVASTY